MKNAKVDRSQRKLNYLYSTTVIYMTISTVESVLQFVCPFIRRSQFFFSLKSPWNHPLTPGLTPGTPGHAVEPAMRAFSGFLKDQDFHATFAVKLVQWYYIYIV